MQRAFMFTLCLPAGAAAAVKFKNEKDGEPFMYMLCLYYDEKC